MHEADALDDCPGKNSRKRFFFFWFMMMSCHGVPSCCVLNDHACKQLVGVVIEYIDMEWETIEELRSMIAADIEIGDLLPPRVATALNILRHEKIGRWESDNWVWAEAPTYEPSVLQIADGRRDRIKQDALYVRVGRDGSIVSVPTEVTHERANEEYTKADRYKWFVKSVIADKERDSRRYKKVRETMRVLFHS